jgi:hypothetical protein
VNGKDNHDATAEDRLAAAAVAEAPLLRNGNSGILPVIDEGRLVGTVILLGPLST